MSTMSPHLRSSEQTNKLFINNKRTSKITNDRTTKTANKQTNTQTNKGATVVAVSSSAHYASYDEGILPNIEAMNDETKYDRRKAYGQSKLANVLFAQELSRRVAGTGVLVNSIHPGGVDTELFRHIFDLIETKVGISIEFLKGKGTWHPRDAALTQDYAAIAPQVKIGGRYLHPIARENKPDPHAQNEALQKHLWDTTEEFISNWKAINKS